MNNDVAPIRPDIEPTVDVERELRDYTWDRIRGYVERNGEPPVSIAIVLLGRDHGGSADEAHSWSPGEEERSRLHCCSTASALLLKRALGL